MPGFQTRIRKARFVVSPFTTEDMVVVGNAMCDVIRARVKKGVNANDATAKRLKPGPSGRRGYPDYKAARGLQPIRDWTWTGRTLRSLKTLSADENRCTIGFTDSRSDRIAHINNLSERMFGVSPNDAEQLHRIVLAVLQQRQHSIVVFQKVA